MLFVAIGCKQSTNNHNNIVFKYNESAGITSLDPAFGNRTENIWVLNQIYNGLVEMDTGLNVIPSTAKRWTISEDGLTYTFFLRDDVYFHLNKCFGKNKTRRCKAQDFEYSFKRIMDNETASPGMWVFAKVKSIEALNDTTLKIELIENYSPFLSLLSTPYGFAVAEEAVTFYKENFRSNPVGTGPFYLKIWMEGEKMVLRKNVNYFEKDKFQKPLPYIDAINISFIKDKQNAYLQFLKKKFDYLSGIDGSYKDDLLNSVGEINLKHKDSFKIRKFTYLKTDYIGFNLSSNNPIVKNKKFRQAVSCSIDREKLIKYLRNNIGKPSKGNFIPTVLLNKTLNSVYFEYNPMLAKNLLAEVKNENPNSTIEITLSTSSSFSDIAEFLQQQLAETGIKLKIEIVPSAINSEQISKGDVELFRKTWIADYPEAENFLTLFYSKNIPPQGANYSRFINRNFDEYFENMNKSNSIEERQHYAFLCDSIIAENCPVIALFHDEAVVAYNPKFTDIGFNAMNILNIKRAKMK